MSRRDKPTTITVSREALRMVLSLARYEANGRDTGRSMYHRAIDQVAAAVREADEVAAAQREQDRYLYAPGGEA